MVDEKADRYPALIAWLWRRMAKMINAAASSHASGVLFAGIGFEICIYKIKPVNLWNVQEPES